MNLIRVVCVGFLILETGVGCRNLRVDRHLLSDQSGEESGSGSPTGPSPIPATTLTNSVMGFSAWGGTARSSRYMHFADPTGLLTADLETRGEKVQGAIGFNPSEVLAPSGEGN